MSGQHIRIVVVDDHAVVRHGLTAMLASAKDLEVVGAAANGTDALCEVQRTFPDVVLLDLQMPGMNGLDVLARLRDLASPPHVIVLTVHDDDDLVLGAVRGGADGFVLKNATKEDLLSAIRNVAEGGQRFDDVVVRAFLKEQSREEDARLLTSREIDILKLVASGHSNREIAAALILSLGTVKTHLDDVYRKLGVSDRAHAVAVAMRRGLLDEG